MVVWDVMLVLQERHHPQTAIDVNVKNGEAARGTQITKGTQNKALTVISRQPSTPSTTCHYDITARVLKEVLFLPYNVFNWDIWDTLTYVIRLRMFIVTVIIIQHVLNLDLISKSLGGSSCYATTSTCQLSVHLTVSLIIDFMDLFKQCFYFGIIV